MTTPTRRRLVVAARAPAEQAGLGADTPGDPPAPPTRLSPTVIAQMDCAGVRNLWERRLTPVGYEGLAGRQPSWCGTWITDGVEPLAQALGFATAADAIASPDVTWSKALDLLCAIARHDPPDDRPTATMAEAVALVAAVARRYETGLGGDCYESIGETAFRNTVGGAATALAKIVLTTLTAAAGAGMVLIGFRRLTGSPDREE